MNSKTCQHIGMAIKFCKLASNPIKKTSEGWTNASKIYHMLSPLTPELKQRIQDEVPSLEYWRETSDSHYEPDEGFFCNACKDGMSFPVKK